MRRKMVVVALALLGVLVGSAAAAFVSHTSNGPSSFTTKAVASRPVISGTRITPNADCSVAAPGGTIRQGTTYYVCVQSVTDTAGVASVTADLSVIEGNSSVPLFTAGGPWSGYAYRSAGRTAGVPLETGTSGAWAVRATNTTGDATTLAGLTFNVRSYAGLLLGEFGAAATANVVQYYRLSDSGANAANLITAFPATGTYVGAPTRQVPGALVGSSDTAVELNGTTDYVTVPRRSVIGANYTLETWVKGSATSGSGAGTVWSDSAGLIDAGTTASANDFGVAVDGTGRVVAGCGNGATIRSGAGALTDGGWHHVAFTRTRTTGAIALYVDGVQVAASAACNTTNQTGSTTVWFGRSHESGRYLNATLDEPVLSSRVLTAAELLDHYRLGSGTG